MEEDTCSGQIRPTTRIDSPNKTSSPQSSEDPSNLTGITGMTGDDDDEINAHRDHRREDGGGETILRVLTLNCWGLWVVSKLRSERFRAIADFLAQSNYDAVFLQEVWTKADFAGLAEALASKYQYQHYFDNGVIGSGTCIFSKTRLEDVNYHEYSMNGYPTNFWHGDWFASKGIGVCQTKVRGFDVHLYVTHFHANYDPENDIYLAHRIVQAFECAQWLKLTSSASDLTVFAGDLNTSPDELPYKLLKCIAPVKDSWLDCCWAGARRGNSDAPSPDEDGSALASAGGSGGETHATAGNSFAADSHGKHAVRIDYVFHCSGPDVEARTQSCCLPLPHRVPGRSFSYSDHEAVESAIWVKWRTNQNDEAVHRNASEYRRAMSVEQRSCRMDIVSECLRVIDKSIGAIRRRRIKFLGAAVAFVLLFTATFLPSTVDTFTTVERIAFDWGLFLPRLILPCAFVIAFLMGTIFTQREINALTAARKQMSMVMDLDLSD